MAVVAELLVVGASRPDADRLDERMGQTMQGTGGPPDGLMVHIGRPTKDGLLITDVWRTEGEWQTFLDGTLLPLIDECGLTAETPIISPVWQFGRP
jgi:hypothetical protein